MPESESEKQRLNRNLDQLLQELRVVLPGVQVLFAFLLAVPFSSRFSDVDDFERDVYFVALLLSALAVALPDGAVDPAPDPLPARAEALSRRVSAARSRSRA